MNSLLMMARNRCMTLFVAVVAAASPAPAAQLSDFNPWLWSHASPSYDLTVDALLSPAGFVAWRPGFAAAYAGMIDAVLMSPPSPAIVGTSQQKTGYTLQEISFPFPSGPTIGTLLAVPTTVDPVKPLIIAIHGHEMVERGTTPWTMFNAGVWAEKWAQAGYVVWAPSHLWYTQLAAYYAQGKSHHIVWTKMLSRLLDAAASRFPAHEGLVAAGLSSGGMGAAFLMAYRSDIKAGTFAGALYQLDWFRENYRLAGFPNNWDIKGVFDYAPIYALIAPRPAQWQMGRQDGLFPKTTAVPASGCCFPGLPRPVSVLDMMGEWLVIERAWEMAGGAPPSLHLHSGGHVYDFDAGKAFIEAK